MYIYKRESFNKDDEILPKDLAIGSTVNSCTFLQGSQLRWFLLCPRTLSARPSLQTAVPRTFSLLKSQFFPLHGLSFQYRLIVAN